MLPEAPNRHFTIVAAQLATCAQLRVGALALSISRRASVLCMIRGTGDRGMSTEVCDMKVLLTLYGEERPAQEFSPEDGAAEMAAWQAFGEAAQAAGVLIACEGLAPSPMATTIRVQG